MEGNQAATHKTQAATPEWAARNREHVLREGRSHPNTCSECCEGTSGFCQRFRKASPPPSEAGLLDRRALICLNQETVKSSQGACAFPIPHPQDVPSWKQCHL